MLFLILIASSLIGRFLSKKYVYRLQELEEMKNALNIFKTKIKFTYEPIPEIFTQISEMSNKNIGNIFYNAKEKMKCKTANIAWEEAIEESIGNLKQEDKNVLKNLSKLLGQTDCEGQISQIEVTQNFLEGQIKEARRRKTKK
jgi:stage III sporulation protein AB